MLDQIRPLLESDRSAVLALFLSLDAASLRTRFGMAMRPDGVERYVNKFDFQKTTLIGAFDGSRLIGLCEAYDLSENAEPVAEAAFIVDPAYRGKHVGRQLGDYLLDNTKEAVVLMCVEDNPPMRRLADGLGFERVRASGHPCLSPVIVKDLHSSHGLWVHRRRGVYDWAHMAAA